MYKTRNLPNTRIDVADALRGIAVAGIILYHSVEHFDIFTKKPIVHHRQRHLLRPRVGNVARASGEVHQHGDLSFSSVDVAADSITKRSSSSVLLTKSFITNSAIGLRQMFPWQTKSILCFAL